ncbi:glycosyltransferase family 2 protein [Streptomyces maoxianensis]|uniref:Glycosyltransferase family 2 protein n=1 Tax=Streptomyces maoxianensis TaxID=1459942 RepID=A0ABV9GCG5_9ACTN|nr:glycosyltransferase family 2 protein [Streptomyces sp. ISL-1]
MSSVLHPAAPGQDPFIAPSHHGNTAESTAHSATQSAAAQSAGAGPEAQGAGRIAHAYRPISSHLAITPPVSVVIPAMNEAENLPYVFKTLPDWIHEVVLVDGNSSDNTVQVARELWPDVKVVKQVGKGKGDALISGFAACTGDIIVMVDADGSADGQEIVSYVSALVSGADFAKGSRFANGGGTDDMTPIRKLGNWVLCTVVNAKFGARYTDLCYGYNAFWRHCLDRISLDCTGFEIETLMNIRVVKAGLRVQEVPSHEYLRIHGVSNLRAVRDGLRVLRVILKEKGVRRAERRRPAALSIGIPRGGAS